MHFQAFSFLLNFRVYLKSSKISYSANLYWFFYQHYIRCYNQWNYGYVLQTLNLKKNMRYMKRASIDSPDAFYIYQYHQKKNMLRNTYMWRMRSPTVSNFSLNSSFIWSSSKYRSTSTKCAPRRIICGSPWGLSKRKCAFSINHIQHKAQSPRITSTYAYCGLVYY